jgi:plasmid stability protein
MLVCWYPVRVKATFDLDADLYRAIRVEAARSDRSVKDVVDEALRRWIEAQEDAEDLAAAEVAMTEYERDGGRDAHEVFGRLVAEHAATYESGGS